MTSDPSSNPGDGMVTLRPPLISNDDLKKADIPYLSDGWRAISRFAYTFSGYNEAKRLQMDIRKVCSKDVIESLDEARLRLFMFARGEAYWSQGDPRPELLEKVDKVLAYIRSSVKD